VRVGLLIAGQSRTGAPGDNNRINCLLWNAFNSVPAGYIPPCDGTVGVMLIPCGASGFQNVQITIAQVPLASLPIPCVCEPPAPPSPSPPVQESPSPSPPVDDPKVCLSSAAPSSRTTVLEARYRMSPLNWDFALIPGVSVRTRQARSSRGWQIDGVCCATVSIAVSPTSLFMPQREVA
jgi:hypothetical protein